MMTERCVRILGIDPGTAIVGWAVVEACAGGRVTQVAYGCVRTAQTRTDAARLAEIARDLQAIITRYAPTEAGVEQLFYFKNQKTIITVAQSRGVILEVLARNGLRIGEYTPPQVKQALTGHGRADKRQMQEMVARVFGLAAPPQPDDAADALAVAFCHSASRRLGALRDA